MKRLVLLILFIGLTNCTNAQKEKNPETLSTAYIQKHAAYFTVENGKINGKGRKMIKKNDQFFAVHYLWRNTQLQTSILANKVIHAIIKKGELQLFCH